MITLVIILIATSCKKSSNDFLVEYKIQPANNLIIQISYNDQSGILKSVNSIDQFGNGTKDISVSQKPFTAKLEVEVNNNTAETVHYILIIYVDGQLKNSTQLQAPPMTSMTTGQIEYTVN